MESHQDNMAELESRQEFFGEALQDEDILADLEAYEAEVAADQMGNLAPQ